MQDVTRGHLRQKLCASGAIGDIAAREHEGDGSALSVSAFPITYAARLDAVTKLHGISSSMRL
jgi:hypothetical protein